MKINFSIILIFITNCLLANNVNVSNLLLEDENIVKCDINWDNSWHYVDSIAPNNYDAIWLFVKGKRLSDELWETVMLRNQGHQINDNFQIDIANAQLGAMIHRSVNGEGNSDLSIEISLDVESVREKYSAVQVFVIEMVYINQGAFYLGDSISNNSLMEYSTKQPYFVASEDVIEVGESSGKLWTNGDYSPATNISMDYPKGFNGFYLMKYEISQAQYVDFLNTLTSVQQENRKLSTLVESQCFSPDDHIEGERNFIVEIDGKFGCDANGNGQFGDVNDGDNVACNFLTWADLTAYLDWSGLRPMTELEFEKACRGGNDVVVKEMAWGNSNAVNTTEVNLTADAFESSTNNIPSNSGLANFGYCLPSGPLRCGFAATSNSTRLESGATYYGAMEMSGNLWELCVALTEEGLNFEGNHGDGKLDEDGYANELNWDSIIGDASGFRGGGWNSGVLSNFNDLAVSDRFFAFLNGNSISRGTTGGRGVISKSMFE